MTISRYECRVSPSLFKEILQHSQILGIVFPEWTSKQNMDVLQWMKMPVVSVLDHGCSSCIRMFDSNALSVMHRLAIVVVLYIGIGMALKYKLKEERGVDMIPNIEFWKGFPSLVKDGCVYSYRQLHVQISKCSGSGSPSQPYSQL